MTITVKMKRYNYLTDNNRQHLTAAQKQAGEMLQINENEDYKAASELKNKNVERPPVFSCNR